MVSVARDEDEPYVTGDEGVGNRRDRPALEISVEDRKIKVGFPRRFQRLVKARSLGGDGIAERSHSMSASSMRIISSSSTTRSLVCFAGCASVATLRPFAGTGTYPGRKSFPRGGANSQREPRQGRRG